MKKKIEKVKKIKKKNCIFAVQTKMMMKYWNRIIERGCQRNNGRQKTANIAEGLPFVLFSKQGKADSLFEYLDFSIFKILYIYIYRTFVLSFKF